MRNSSIRTETIDLQDIRRLADSNRWNRPQTLASLKPLRKAGKAAYVETPGPLETPCWIWQGCINSKGYPVRGTKDGRYLVHRRVVEEATGIEVPAGIQVHHVCETRACVNPLHLVSRSAIAHAREHFGLTAGELVVSLVNQFGEVGTAEVAALADTSGRSINTLRTALSRAVTRGEIVRVERGRFKAAA